MTYLDKKAAALIYLMQQPKTIKVYAFVFNAIRRQ